MRTSISRWRRRLITSAPAGIAAIVLLGSAVPVPDDGASTTVVGVSLSSWAHLVGYGALSLALAEKAFHMGSRPTLASTARIVLAATAYGVFVEAVQFVIPYRRCSPVDVGINALGATMSLVGRAVVRRWWSDTRD